MPAKTRVRMRPSKRKYSKYPRNTAKEVRTEMRHKRAGKHRVKKRDRVIAIGLAQPRKKSAKARRADRRAA
jgi:hypothetical protein